MRRELCNICLLSENGTKNITTLDENSEKLSVKLQYIAPEIDWLEDYLICDHCIEQLKNACRFKALCLAIKECKEIGVNCYDANEKSGDDNENWDSDSTSINEQKYEDEKTVINNLGDLFVCHDCGEKFTEKAQLVWHIKCAHDRLKQYTLNDDEHNGKYKLREFRCIKCGRKYALETTLNEHLRNCDGIRRHVKSKAVYQCDNCKKYYTTKKILKAHSKICELESESRKTEYQCTKCNKYYVSSKTLKDHYKRGCKKESDSVKGIFCNVCDEYFKTEYLLKQHILEEHKISDYHCDECIINFDTQEEYEAHQNTKHISKKIINKKKRGRLSSRKFVCEICGVEFTLLKAIILHCVRVHSMEEKTIRPYSCDKCNNRFRSSTNLINHRLYHDRNRVNICSFCGKSFITKNDLTAHEVIHFNSRNYKCDKCEKAFKTNTNLRTHQLIVHTDPSLWKYVCHICNKRFPQKSNHDQHVRRHIGEKNFICSLCKKPFASKSEMQEHVSYHSNVRAYKCEYCGKEYRKKHTYDVHLTKVHGVGNAKIPVREKKHACHICPSRFYDRLKLARHLCIHTGLKPFPCYACDKKFTDKSYLKHHLKIVHSIVEENKQQLAI